MNTTAAENFLRAIDRKSKLYAENPGMGIRVPELGDELRVFAYKRWATIYLPEGAGIKIVGIVDATRDYSAWQAKLPDDDSNK